MTVRTLGIGQRFTFGKADSASVRYAVYAANTAVEGDRVFSLNGGTAFVSDVRIYRRRWAFSAASENFLEYPLLRHERSRSVEAPVQPRKGVFRLCNGFLSSVLSGDRGAVEQVPMSSWPMI
jgi:hypothetical protein